MNRMLTIIACLLSATLLPAQTPNTDPPDLRPTLSVFQPARDDDGLREHAAIGSVVEAPVKPAGLRGTFSSPDASGDYEIALGRPEAGRIEVTYSLTWKGKPDALIAAHGIRIPFAFGNNPRRAKVVVGAPGRPRGEVWWVDPNDMWHIYWMLSDQKERWPLWRLGGITQESPERFVIWKANRADTVPFVVDQGQTAPGWLDVSSYGEEGPHAGGPLQERGHGVTVIWDEMPKRAPCAIEVNYPAKEIEVWFHPPSAAPARAESLGYVPGKPLTWKFSLVYHDDVFPATQKQEVSRAQYVELLRLIDEQKLWQYVAMNCLVPVAGDLDTRTRQAIDTGIQPSELLGNFDTGNTWRMQKLCGAVGARWSNDHAANAKAVLDWCARRAEAGKAAGADGR